MPILFQCNAHELTTSAYASFRKQLLERSFDRTLGNTNSVRNFFVGQSLEYKRQDFPLTLGKPLSFRFIGRRSGLYHRLKEFTIKPYLPGQHIADSFDK